MDGENLIHAHELFLGQIEVVFSENQADSDFLKRACDNLARIIIPPNCLQDVEKRLVELLVAKSQIDEAPAEKAWKKMCILRETIRSIQARQKPKPKLRPKQKREKPASAPSLAGVGS